MTTSPAQTTLLSSSINHDTESIMKEYEVPDGDKLPSLAKHRVMHKRPPVGIPQVVGYHT